MKATWYSARDSGRGDGDLVLMIPVEGEIMLGRELLHDIEGVLGSRGFGLDDLHEEGPPAGDNRFVQRNARYAKAAAARRESPLAQLYRMRRLKPN